MKRKLMVKLKEIILTFTTGIATAQIFVAFALLGCDGWNVTWVPIQIGMFILGTTWVLLFIIANFSTFERR